jgi:hypothetical protein
VAPLPHLTVVTAPGTGAVGFLRQPANVERDAEAARLVSRGWSYQAVAERPRTRSKCVLHVLRNCTGEYANHARKVSATGRRRRHVPAWAVTGARDGRGRIPATITQEYEGPHLPGSGPARAGTCGRACPR